MNLLTSMRTLVLGLLMVAGWGATASATASATAPASATAAAMASDGVQPLIETPHTETVKPKVALLKIDTQIDMIQVSYLERALAKAKEENVDIVVTYIDSPGGLLFAAEEMVNMVVEAGEDDGPRMVAFVDQGAYSAAAMISYAHEAVYMKPGAIIGNIGVIFQGPDGEIKYAPEKIETVVRTLLRKLAQLRGWDQALMTKMTSRTQKLWEARHEDGRRQFVLEEDAATYLADNPDIDKENSQQWVLKKGDDHLLTLTSQEALETAMATAEVASLEDLYSQLGVAKEDVLDLSPSGGERWARTLTGFSGLFLSLAILFVIFELKTVGVGLFATLAGVCGLLFLLTTYSLDLITYGEIVLIVIGIILLAVEIMTAIGGGLIGALGGACLLAGIALVVIPSGITWDFNDPDFLHYLGAAFVQVLIALPVFIFGALAFITLAPRLPFIQAVSATGAIEGTSAGAVEEREHSLSNRIGVTVSELHPGGNIIIDDEEFSAVSENGQFIAEGAQIEVVGSAFGEMVVKPYKPKPEYSGEEGEA